MQDTNALEADALSNLPDDFADLDNLPLLHDRTYQVRSYYESPDRLRLRGMVCDQKPAGLLLTDDDRPLMVHHMVVDLWVTFPELRIVEATAVLETHPHEQCPRIQDHYRNLVGLSIARGFTHKVRELFGGLRGCTHTTALLQAMAPVAIQSIWSMRAQAGLTSEDGPDSSSEPVAAPRMISPDERRQMMMGANLNTCHVWASDSELVAAIEQGESVPPPLWARKRLRELGREPDDWAGG